MSESRRCPRCGADLRADEAEGLCPACLLNLALDPEGGSRPGPSAAAPATGRAGFVPPEPAGLARHFPQLEVQGVLGQGGMGVVYRARQPKLDRLVALKILPPEVGLDPAFAERFTREARALARLDHPGIVAVYDFGQSEGLYYLVMQYVDGSNLRQLLRSGRLRPALALRIVPQICEALQYAHDRGVVHRDIKPENVLLDRRGQVKIADFGLAKLLGQPPADLLTGSGQVMGTPHYMAPEQMERPLAVDHRADIYSLGVVFYELLTGELPLGRFAPPSQKAPVDARLDPVVLRALEKEPGRRYQHAGEVKTEVESIAPPPGQAEAIREGPAPEATRPFPDAAAVEAAERPPRAEKPAARLPRGFWWKTLALVAVMYGVSFALPAYHFYTSWDRGPGEHGWMAQNSNSSGWACFHDAWVMQYTCWYANPALWLGCALLLLRRWLWAGLAALAALALGLSVWDPFSQSAYLFGYWLWLASMAALAAGSLYGWWVQRGAPFWRRRGRGPAAADRQRLT